MVADQLKLEKEREAELELLYQEEAAKIWEKREAEWEKERKARERLMQEVNHHTGRMLAFHTTHSNDGPASYDYC